MGVTSIADLLPVTPTLDPLTARQHLPRVCEGARGRLDGRKQAVEKDEDEDEAAAAMAARFRERGKCSEVFTHKIGMMISRQLQNGVRNLRSQFFQSKPRKCRQHVQQAAEVGAGTRRAVRSSTKRGMEGKRHTKPAPHLKAVHIGRGGEGVAWTLAPHCSSASWSHWRFLATDAFDRNLSSGTDTQ